MANQSNSSAVFVISPAPGCKHCTRCDTTKDASEFGVHPWCLHCCREYTAERAEAALQKLRDRGIDPPERRSRATGTNAPKLRTDIATFNAPQKDKPVPVVASLSSNFAHEASEHEAAMLSVGASVVHRCARTYQALDVITSGWPNGGT